MKDWNQIMNQLATDDYVILDDFIDEKQLEAIQNYIQKNTGKFDQAKIGRRQQEQLRGDIRKDETFWLEPFKCSELSSVWGLIEALKDALNHYCFLSISDYEFHVCHYAEGAFYKKHLDQFDKSNNRLVSMVLYLNDEWLAGDGGELAVYDLNGKRLQEIAPIARRCVLFKSAEVPHEVLKANKSRYSWTGWFLYRPIFLS